MGVLARHSATSTGRAVLQATASARGDLLCHHFVGEKEDGEAKGIFDLKPQDQKQGGQRRARRERGREGPESGQAPARAMGEDPRRARRERPLPSSSELQVLSSEAEGAGGAGRPEQEMHRSSCFEDEPQTAPLVATVSV